MVYDLKQETILNDYIKLRLEIIRRSIDETPEGNKLYQEMAHEIDETMAALKGSKLFQIFDERMDLGMRYAYLVGLHDGMNVDVIEGKIA